ncbi:MAG: Isoleucine-tRNA ligase [candidate division TM6 bacterium GW2011_GWF2_43_17]|nr:MAG: Isoleucine-tRNA ligase [candidate division TM6 bacterium GW2011_GWF2_43_17]HAU30415.1 isoleucine--tRNA ligase [Candidatus Dependentiae bacterium]
MSDVVTSAEVPEKDFKDTLNLPRTDFSLRADAKINDPIMLQRWEKEDLATQAMSCNKGHELFVLHDGPPYANGHIHLGHAYNKVLKDIITKAYRMMGFHVPVVPGWDCHGLPIEQKVSQEYAGLQGPALKQACREYAHRWVNTQREEFKKLGVLMDWQHPYITMDPSYEASILRAFASLVRQGFVERKNKTIPWCPHCATALATAEIEYAERKDPSVYILFPVQERDATYLVIWTTTPWTIPLNQAVMVRPGALYVRVKAGEASYILGKDRYKAVMEAVGIQEYVVEEELTTPMLRDLVVRHPLVNRLVPVIEDINVGLDEGTACVHCAPGCGPIDYEVGIKNALPIYSPITSDGRYDADIDPLELQGVSVADGQIWVLKRLKELGYLLASGSIRHSYPHCWRCHNALIFRATPQWFCNLQHDQIKDKAVAAVEDIAFFPEQGRTFLRSTIENRWEWCLSRQRKWGVPIPALIHTDNVSYQVLPGLIDYVADQVAQYGVEYWDAVTLEELQRAGVVPAEVALDDYRKEQDILDVWFDSGVSHFAVLNQRPELRGVPADLYLEGIDQHRGWFQSSLLTSMILNQKAPMRRIMTHGFTVDEQGRKMSKSLGNVVTPDELIEQVGTDGLRLWVASIGNEGDAVLSKALIQNVVAVYRKVRNTTRFLLQNLYDYTHNQDALSLDELLLLDQYALYRLLQFSDSVQAAYKRFDLTEVFRLVAEFCSVEVSAFYGDIVKDRLYCDAGAGLKRRSAQTVLWYILDTITRLIAPIFSLMAEQVTDFYQGAGHTSIHLQPFADLADLRSFFAKKDLKQYEKDWNVIRELRSLALKVIEEQRAQGVIKHPLEVALVLSDRLVDDIGILKAEGFDRTGFLQELFVASRVVIQPLAENAPQVAVEHANGVKCPRCWQWVAALAEQGVCSRCSPLV